MQTNSCLGAVGLCVALTLPAAASAQGQGFTFEYDLGVSATQVSDETRLGFGGLTLGLGFFVTPRMALLARTSGTGFFERAVVRTKIGGTSTDTLISLGASYYGAQLQYFVTDDVFLAAGPGAVVLGPPQLLSPLYKLMYEKNSIFDSTAGFGGAARAGMVFWRWKQLLALRAGAEFIYGHFEDQDVKGLELFVGLQVW